MVSDDFDPERDWDEEEFKANPDAWFRRVYDDSVKKQALRPFDPELHYKRLSYDEKKGGMLPKMEHTISLTSPGHWSLGSLMTCEKIEAGQDIPSDTVCQWVDDELTYCLRKRSEPKTDRTFKGDPKEVGLFWDKTTSGSWMLSPNVFCKVMWWCEDSTTDATTIRFVNKNIPSLPTQEIMYDWIDPEWCRSFMLTRRAPGTRYDKAWESLTTEQKLQVAAQVAKHLKSLAELTSDYIETVSGRGLEGRHSLRLREDLPGWKPRVEPRVSREEYREFLKRRDSGHEPPNFGERFVLQHPDLNPTNFFITTPSDSNEVPRVTAIIDWSNVGYFPTFYVATFPRGRLHFAVEHRDGADWMWMLSNALVKEGFPLEMEYITRTTPDWSICAYNLPN